MKYKVPSNFHPAFNAGQIAERTDLLGREIGEWARGVQERTAADVLAVPVLRGAVFFFCDLVRKMGTSVEMAPIKTCGYDPSKNMPADEIMIDLEDVAAERRSVLLIDDVCDSGRTLKKVQDAFVKAGAHEVKTAVLIRRVIENPPMIPDWVGFEYKDPYWFVGYGMDDCDRWRNLPDVYIIKPSEKQ